MPFPRGALFSSGDAKLTFLDIFSPDFMCVVEELIQLPGFIVLFLGYLEQEEEETGKQVMVKLEDQMNNENLEMLQKIFEVRYFKAITYNKEKYFLLFDGWPSFLIKISSCYVNAVGRNKREKMRKQLIKIVGFLLSLEIMNFKEFHSK